MAVSVITKKFKMTDIDLYNRRKIDKLKEEVAKRNNFNFLRISFKEHNNIGDILNAAFRK